MAVEGFDAAQEFPVVSAVDQHLQGPSITVIPAMINSICTLPGLTSEGSHSAEEASRFHELAIPVSCSSRSW